MADINIPMQGANEAPTCILVADEHAARFFLRAASHERLRELPDLAESADFLEHDERLNQSLRRVAGRTMVRTRRECRREERAVFARRVASRLEQAIPMLAARKVALCAPPDILALLREQMRPETRKLLTSELGQERVPQSAEALESVMLAAGI